MLKMKAKVKILNSQKTDGRFNFGRVVGIEMTQNGLFLGYTSEREFMSRFTIPRYKVAYVDCFTAKACAEWFDEAQLERA